MEKKQNKLINYNANGFDPLVNGKKPPQAIDLEEYLLGCLLIDREVITEIVDIISVDIFYLPAHQIIFETILELFNASQPIDMTTVVQQLREKEQLDTIGGSYYIVLLTQKVTSTGNVEYYARKLIEKHIKRSLIKECGKISTDSFEEGTDAFELLDQAETKIFGIGENNIKKNYNRMSDLIGEVKKQIKEAADKPDGVSGVPSGFTELDRITSGFQNSDLIIIAARPGMGKTSFVLSLARNVAVDFEKPLAFFSLEMSATQIVMRLISSETGFGSEKLRKGKLEDYEWEQLDHQIKRLEKAPIFIDDTPSLSILEFRAKARRLKSKHGVQLIVIDYLQLMTVSDRGMNREQEISQISRSLKAIAKELNIPIIALAQLSRDVEKRGGAKIPQLSDLRESGAIEQDADIVMFIYRPEYYNLDQDEKGNSTKGVAEVHIGKHRNGALGNLQLQFVDSLAKFKDLDIYDDHDASVTMASNSDFDEDITRTVESKINNNALPPQNNGEVMPF